MSSLKIYTFKGLENQSIENPIDKFQNKKIQNQSIFDSVVSELNSRRQSTSSVKNKSEVSGGGRKPYKQKHTGRARQGSIRNPHYVGGGVVFGPTPEKNYKKIVNKKVFKLAYESSFLNIIENKKYFILSDNFFLEVKKPSTKLFFLFLKSLSIEKKKILLIIDEKNKILEFSSKNISNLILKKINQLSSLDMINNSVVLFQKSCFLNIIEKIKN